MSQHNQKRVMAISLVAGLLFGFGLTLSQMIHPQKVIAFLNVMGDWDATLLFVMTGAVAVYAPGYWLLARKMSSPVLTEQFHLPRRKEIDSSLLIGSSLFGIGWGIAGICPGPAIANLISGNMNLLIFVAAMLAGLFLSNRLSAVG